MKFKKKILNIDSKIQSAKDCNSDVLLHYLNVERNKLISIQIERKNNQISELKKLINTNCPICGLDVPFKNIHCISTKECLRHRESILKNHKSNL